MARRFLSRRGAEHRRPRFANPTRLRLETLEPRCLLSAGALDPTFGGDGKVVLPPVQLSEGYQEFANDIAIQSDGKILVVGEVGFGSRMMAIARYNANGNLDTTFDADGKLTLKFAVMNDQINGVAIQADGKIVLAGSNDDEFAVLRLNTNGSLDTTFDGDGMVRTTIGSTYDRSYAESVAIQADGKIVLAGTSGGDFALARYNTNGSLDTTFDGDGKLITSFGTADAEAYDVAIQSDGKIVVAGIYDNSSSGTSDDFALARYNTDGSLDTTFDGDGKLTTDIYGGADTAYGLAIQTNGKIVAVGNGLARYNTDGSLDAAFNGDGKQGSSFRFEDVAIQPDGKIVAAGEGSFALARYTANGSLDTTFDGDGMLTTSFFGSSYDHATSVAIQSDGKIVAGGWAYHSQYGMDFGLARYDTNGSLDTTFDGDGKATNQFSGSTDYASSIALQPDGKIVLAGRSHGGSSNEAFALARINPNGSPDTSFDGDGMLATSFGGNDGGAQSVAIQPDGKIVAAGVWSSSFALARYNTDGSLDTTFDTDGMVTTSFGGTSVGKSLAIQSDGKIVLAGYSNSSFALARYNTDGSLDTTFDGDGYLTTAFAAGSAQAYGVAIQSDGKIVAAGKAPYGSYTQFALARYNTDGSLDTTFDGDGMLTTPVAFYSEANSVAIQSDGKIVAAGSAHGYALARYNTDGSLDTTFDGDGMLTTAMGDLNSSAYSVAIQTDGRIVAAGFSYSTNSYSQLKANFSLARYNVDGSLDTTFDGDGKLSTSFGDFHNFGMTAAIQADGRIVAAGNYNTAEGGRFAAARYDAGPLAFPEISVLGGGLVIVDGDATPSSADDTDFGGVGQGSAAVARTYTVQNDGDQPLLLGAVSVPAGYTLTEGLSTNLAPAASDTFTVELNTGTVGTFAGDVSFFNNDGDGGDGIENPFNFRITGTVNVQLDFADAPDTGAGTGPGNYNTLSTDAGPGHVIVANLYMGSAGDAEAEAFQSAGADGDDNNGIDDEDGLTVPPLFVGLPPAVDVTVTNNTGSPATLYGWIDYNADGLFDNATERASLVVADGTAASTVALTFPAVPLGSAADTYARFRLSTDVAAADPTGISADGEVEDYQVSISGVDFGDAPDTGPGTAAGNYNTLSTDSGPSHVIVADLLMGTILDAEAEAFQSAGADGDDNNGTDDEDGLIDPVGDLTLTVGVAPTVDVIVTNNTGSSAMLVGWIDYDGDGLFDNLSERALVPVPNGTFEGTFTLTFPVVPGGSAADTYARFRLSTDLVAAFDPTGAAADGEVEDYSVVVQYATIGLGDRHIFYDNSHWDGNTAGPNTSGGPSGNGDDGAIAPVKQALLPSQTATFANYTSYSRGLNGIMVDVAGLANPAGIDAADFIFRVGNDNAPGGWPAAPAPTSVGVRPGAGDGGSDRVTIIWADNAIENEWLQVTVVANADTGLVQNDVFYAGNRIGEANGSFQVLISDMYAVYLGLAEGVGIVDPSDFDRNGAVRISDMYAAYLQLPAPALQVLTAPVALLESIDSVFGENLSWSIELMWLDELYGSSADSEEAEDDDPLTATAADGVSAVYYDE